MQIAVAVAGLPLLLSIVTVGTVSYPDPGSTTVMLYMVFPSLRAIAVAFTPANTSLDPALIVTARLVSNCVGPITRCTSVVP